MTSSDADDLTGHRGRLFGLAYRLLGTVADAEDVVQDVAETWARTDRSTVDDPEAWLVTVATRRSLDRLRSAQHRREAYVGPWLPEPVAHDPSETSSDPADLVAVADEVSFAMLVVLDQLSPPERVAFVLHDVFGLPFDRLASVLERSPEAARKLASRARQRVHDAVPPGGHDPVEAREVTEAFLAAARDGDLEGLVRVLHPDAVLISDGGGLVTAARRPVVGSERIARFILGLATKSYPDGRAEAVVVNGEPGFRLSLGERPIAVGTLEVREGRVRAVRFVVNPDKLRHAT